MAFVPVAFYVNGSEVSPQIAPLMTPQELGHYNERSARALAAGRMPVTRECRATLGEGYSGSLRQGAGVSALVLMEMRLSADVFVLGWGWVWAKSG